MTLSRIVQAYATVKGIGFNNSPFMGSGKIKGSSYNCIVEEKEDKKYLNFQNFRIVLPDTEKIWGIEEATNVWNCIDHLMNIGKKDY